MFLPEGYLLIPSVLCRWGNFLIIFKKQRKAPLGLAFLGGFALKTPPKWNAICSHLLK
jgi:hypothetical protein